MLEENLNEGEGENLNPEAVTEANANDDVEALKRQISNSERGVQKVIQDKKNLEKAMDELGKVADEPAHLVDLYESDPEVAKIILKKYYDNQDIESFKESIGYQVDLSDPETVKRHIEKEAERRLAQRRVEDAKAAFVNRLEMTAEEKKAFDAAFEERTQLKSFKPDDVEKHLEKAYREIADEDQIRNLRSQETVARSMATGNGGQAGKSEPKRKDPLSSEISDFLKKFS